MKDYTFTLEEMYVIREALINEYLRLHDYQRQVPERTTERGQRLLNVLEALKEQFKTDCRITPT